MDTLIYFALFAGAMLIQAAIAAIPIWLIVRWRRRVNQNKEHQQLLQQQAQRQAKAEEAAEIARVQERARQEERARWQSGNNGQRTKDGTARDEPTHQGEPEDRSSGGPSWEDYESVQRNSKT